MADRDGSYQEAAGEVWGVEKHEKDVNQATQAIMILIEAYLEELHVG